MAQPASLSFLAGLFVLLYLSSFVFFALLRVITGISIQRIGYSGLRRISFAPRDGLRIDIRGLGLTLHRPTFAQPTWFSIVLTELKITVDLKSLNGGNLRKAAAKKAQASATGRGGAIGTANGNAGGKRSGLRVQTSNVMPEGERSRTWRKLTEIKNYIKRLHRKIQWIRMADLVATSTTLVVEDVGTMQIGNLTMAVDTRRKTVDRSRLFQHRRASSQSQRPAEWIFSIRSVLFTPEGKDSTEILDHCTLNIHGLLYKDLDGLRDASIALKLGRFSLPLDDIQQCIEAIRKSKSIAYDAARSSSDTEISFNDIVEELDAPGSREDSIVQAVSDSKEFVSSILRGIHEIQFAISFFGITQCIRDVPADGAPVYLNTSMKEIGLDVLRLDPKSPAHLMYFSPNDIAHQALITAISISVGIDDDHEHPERLLYVPMATATLKTTLPSKTIQYSREKDVNERNTNILFANLVVTSPSLDLDPKHLPLILAMAQSRRGRSRVKEPKNGKPHLISRLLPKASIKISVHEPVIRVTLPPMEPEKKDTDEYDLLIAAMSSISLDVESSHSPGGEVHYSLASNFRVASHQLYYQTASSQKHNLLLTDSLELKAQLTASSEVVVVLSGNFQTFSLYMVRPEITEGLKQIVAQIRSGQYSRGRSHPEQPRENFLRRLPFWLVHIHLQGSEFNIEVAGEDGDVSSHARGAALHLGSWSAEYKANKNDEAEPKSARRRTASRTISKDDVLLRPASPSSPSRRRVPSITDGRRLAIHTQGLEGFVIDNSDALDPEPFLSLPRFEVAFTTSTDKQGHIFHINSFARSLYLQYSLQNHFSIGMATKVLKRTFGHQHTAQYYEHRRMAQHESILFVPSEEDGLGRTGPAEILALDFKAQFVQIKAAMPADPPLMLQVYNVEAGRHRWTSPFVRARMVRLFSEAPMMKRVWSRLISCKGMRLDFRQARRKVGTGTVKERSIDVVTDAIRLAVPHQLVVHKILDNIVNTTKTVQQLHHRFKTDTDEYILDKEPEGPKHVPKVSLRSHAFVFEIEDGSFEWKLGVIYRVGLLEQKQRLAREEAFRLKVKKLEELDQRRGNTRFRARSAHHGRSRSKTKFADEIKRRSRSSGDSDRGGTSRSRGRRMRYDTEGACRISETARMSIEQARERLDLLNAQAWKKRIDHGLCNQNNEIKDIRSMFWGTDDLPDELDQKETILAIPQRPALMAVLISDLNVLIDKPSFPLQEYAQFLHRIGKGMPFDMKYALLVPMNVSISMGEARVGLRDYPLPLLHVPAIRQGQSPRLPSLSLKTDFVIAEEWRDQQSSRKADIIVVPPEEDEDGNERGGLKVTVRRTVAPVKTYSDVSVDINTSYPTRITWGTSYQPAIQDMMQVIESFTKPPIDPSERVGFWDKIRLNFHSRVNVSWKGDGDVHLALKGSRDPYMVTGQGAGFVMCWRSNVRWGICQHEDPRKFMTVDSGEYVLAIPDFSEYARSLSDPENAEDETYSRRVKRAAVFKKTVMKLSGNVQWMAGLVFERNTDEGGRSFDFKPHYDVILKHPKFAKVPPGKEYDAFRGFRSHHIHLSVAIAAPANRDWSLTNLKPSSHYNSVHLTPRFFSHFFSWWSLFSGVMSLPIRQGKLWPGIEKSSKKFGRHLATIKYNLLLSPLFMSHVYKHKDVEDYDQGVVSATGLKIRLNSFMLDLHQRREEFELPDKGHTKGTKTSGMRINQAQLDFISADIRAVSATITGTGLEDLDGASDEAMAAYNGSPKMDVSHFTIPDKDVSWIDMDDFVELDWILPAGSNPETKILPLAYAPRFTYFRQTDHGDTISGDPTRSSAFGNEPTHFCVMSARNDPRRVQCDLIQERLKRVKEQILQNQRAAGEDELRIIRDPSSPPEVHERLKMLQAHGETLRRKKEFLHVMLSDLIKRLDHHDLDVSAVPEVEMDEEVFYEASEKRQSTDAEARRIDAAPLADYVSDFNNRFIVHNMQLKWSNSLRNIILRYIHQVSQRRGFVYYMSRRAVKFILDIVEEQKKAKEAGGISSSLSESLSSSQQLGAGDEDDVNIQERIRQLLDDGQKFVDANDPEPTQGVKKPSPENIGEDIAVDYTAQNTYHVRLIAPQIQLQSEKNAKSAVLVAAKGMQLKVVQIMDKDRVSDEVSGLVQRRFSAAMDSVQIFVTSTKTFSTEYLHMYSGNRYGAPAGSSWPPWVPLEVMFEFQNNPFGFSRVVKRTSASLRYDKYNTLRLKYNDDVTRGGMGGEGNVKPEGLESRMDHLWIDFPHLRAICDSSQYYAVYIIVLDLLLYSEPLEKVRSERLEKIMLASDFSDLTGAPEMVGMLQERIRQLEEIKMHFQINEKSLDRQGWEDRMSMERELTTCEDELFFMMKAITSSQRKADDRQQTAQSTGLLQWYLSASEIVWHLVREGGESLAEFQLKQAIYARTDNNDGSNYNNVEIARIHGLNLLPDALYPEMIAPYHQDVRGFPEGSDAKMLRVQWYMLEAIAGIPVLDHFEVNLYPLKVQLEREIGKKLFEYIFPGVGSGAFENGGGFSPFLVKHMLPTQEEEDESENNIDSSTPYLPDSGNDSDSAQEIVSGAGALELRLQPTLTLPDNRRPKSSEKKKSPHLGTHAPHRFMHSARGSSDLRRSLHTTPQQQKSADVVTLNSSRPSSVRSSSGLSVTNGSDSERTKRFTLHRSSSKQDTQKEGRSDDLTQMMNRASNYMTLAYVKIPSMVLCLSYKGKGQRNFEDIHDLVFRMPTLEYRNKTWTNLELALQLKKDVVKALISHAGAIVGNKFSHHRPNRQTASRLREIANSSTLLGTGMGEANESSETGSFVERSPAGDGSASVSLVNEPRRSFASGRGSVMSTTESLGSSLNSAPPASRSGHPSRSINLAYEAPRPEVPSSSHSAPADEEVRFTQYIIKHTANKLFSARASAIQSPDTFPGRTHEPDQEMRVRMTQSQ
ncbi:mitochondrial protein from FMP27-domain-containing protein [Lineolata rhizophorae]|uniref:Mitochondrial protein from FMP27-domain-containing protein n=1 Tax=Lineolata rhizophorae TaxID=578093 RepID=A0A6A6PEC1_9PEZI|nr:mitochondrial protein from FMP27-domain-containing protein [Lineolata rhizophorae]